MRLIQTLLWGTLLSLLCLPVFAWQVKTTDTQVMVSNEIQRDGVDVYLVWFDLDSDPVNFISLTFDNAAWDWQSGLKPVFNAAIDLPVFDSYSIPLIENQACPDTHRCFLAFIATPPDQAPTRSESWLASSFFPLSLSAGCERFPGQAVFLSCDGDANRFYGDVNTVSAGVPEATTDDTTETEKPDIFKRVGDKLLFANGQAKRFQVINIADLSNPRLEGWSALSGSPRELYVLGDFYVLLQSNYVGEDGTLLTVLRQNQDGTVSTVQEKTLPGWFIESRRRGDLIYSVTQNRSDVVILDCVDCGVVQSVIDINVLRLNGGGELEDVDTAQLPGYSPTIAIFPNHLVIANHNPEENQWRTTKIQVFDLSQTDPLVALPILKVPGQVPSEFHLSVLGQQLRVVYGPADRADGSTLAIYDLSSSEMALVGQVDKIAPGEGLFATRFVDNRAFVVTYERTDPLWVIDLSEPSQPKILGELEVPGWSEKMFFHENRLFAVGIDDQPLENEESPWVRRVSLSLFNVDEPTEPSLINRFTPLAGEVNYSWSLALDDERALLLNWEDGFAALSIQSSGNYLQIVSLENDKIEDAGLVKLPVQIQRSLSIAPNVLGALGDQIFQTIQWGTGDLQILGDLELATNLSWLKLQDNMLWAAAMGDQGYYRLYRYIKEDVETPVERWSLQSSYDGLEMDENLVVFYDYYPLTVQVLDVQTGALKPAQALEPTDMSNYAWNTRSGPFVRDGWFYVGEQQNLTQVLSEKDDYYYWQTQWVLRSWELESAKEAANRSIPGRPVAFTAKGDLNTQEFTAQGQLRLNLLALETENARLLHSREMPCEGYSEVMWAPEVVYVTCQTGNIYFPVDEREENDEEPTTQLVKLNPIAGFSEIGRWTLSGSQNLRAVSSEVVLVASSYGGWWYYGPVTARDVAINETGCNIYQLQTEKEPVLLKHLDSCSYRNNIALTPTQAWMAEGFAGIKEINW